MNQPSLSRSNDSKLSPLRRVFGMDVRSLSLFRIALGSIVLIDLWLRWGSLRAMYTDEGILPREQWKQLLSVLDYGDLAQWGSGTWSLHSLSGGVELQIGLFITAAIFAFLLLIGFWTRLATIVSLILLLSLQSRNPMILTSSDTFLKMSLFWSMFVPLGQVWSLDAKIAGRKLANVARSVCNFGTAALIFQIFILYVFTGLAKWNEIWLHGFAMEYVLRLDIYVTPFGKSLLAYPELLKFVSRATVVSEVALPWLLLVAWKNDWMRMINMAVFWAMHIGILLSMSIGLFSYICMIGWLPLIPAVLWDSKVFGARVYDQTTPPPKHRFVWANRIAQACCGVLIVVGLLWNVGNHIQSSMQLPVDRDVANGKRPTISPVVAAVTTLGQSLGISQQFQMFGRPPARSPWFEYNATLADGTRVELLEEKQGTTFNRNPATGKPASVLATIEGHHWRKLHRNLTFPDLAPFRRQLALFAMEDWNRSHFDVKKVVRIQLQCFLQNTGPNYDPNSFHGPNNWGTFPEDQPGTDFEKFLEQIEDGNDIFF